MQEKINTAAETFGIDMDLLTDVSSYRTIIIVSCLNTWWKVVSTKSSVVELLTLV
jgi:hypothetical protein